MVKNPRYPHDQDGESGAEDEFASEDEAADGSGNGDEESKGDADDRSDKITLLPNNTERVFQEAKETLMSAAPEVFAQAWMHLQSQGVEFSQEILDMNINMLK